MVLNAQAAELISQLPILIFDFGVVLDSLVEVLLACSTIADKHTQ